MKLGNKIVQIHIQNKPCSHRSACGSREIGYNGKNRQHEQRLHDHPDAEPVLRLLRRRSDDVLSDVLLHLSGLKKTSRKRRKIRWILLAFRDEIRYNKSTTKGFWCC